VQARLKAQGRLILSADAVQFDDVSPKLPSALNEAG
jgi:hypothetical protein